MVKDLEAIKKQLRALRKDVGATCYELKFGHFVIQIFTHGLGDYMLDKEDDSILNYPDIEVLLFELFRNDKGAYSKQIRLIEDNRFKDYEPIQYKIFPTNFGIINLSDGRNMPINYLCELIYYVNRLANLEIFS